MRELPCQCRFGHLKAQPLGWISRQLLLGWGTRIGVPAAFVHASAIARRAQ